MEKVIFFDYNSVFSSRLRSLIEEKNISKQKLADEIGVSRQAISQYCDGSTVPNADKLLKIAEYFNVSLDFLVGKTEAKTDNKDIQFICDYTGLNESAVNNLNSFYEQAKTFQSFQDETAMKFINFLLRGEVTDYFGSSDGFGDVLFTLNKYILSQIEPILELDVRLLDDSLSSEDKLKAIRAFCSVDNYEKKDVCYYHLQQAFKSIVDEFCSPIVEEYKRRFYDCQHTLEVYMDSDHVNKKTGNETESKADKGIEKLNALSKRFNRLLKDLANDTEIKNKINEQFSQLQEELTEGVKHGNHNEA